uniref:GrpE protein homolog n=1 Tax=Paramormyrops kingsleyae TaxID=1676925 RepID=A0A3B3TB75_9TELE
MLEVADILEKATQSVPKEEVKEDNPHLKNLYDGLVMTEMQIQKVFTKHGLIKLSPEGQKFDPYEHEALFHAPLEGKEPGTVAIVTKVGYKLHGRTLRPALVGVAKAPYGVRPRSADGVWSGHSSVWDVNEGYPVWDH